MNKYLSFFIACCLFTYTSKAQYTSLINSNTPGHTQTPFAVGTQVYQFENTLTLDNIKENSVELKSINNNFNFRYGFWKEKLEASVIHKYIANVSGENGTKVLAIGAKYLVYNPKFSEEERNEYKKSWKKTHGFRIKNLIPSVAVSAHYNSPLTSNNVTTSGSSFSLAAITQNSITSKFRVNNQFEYNFISSDFSEFIYSISGSHVVYRRFNPYLEFRYHNISKKDNPNYLGYVDIGIGTPFLLSRDLAIAIQYNQVFGVNYSGNSFGINVAYRINRHFDRWVTKRGKKKKGKKDIEGSTGGTPGTELIKKEKIKNQDADYLDSILDPKKREKARKKADKKAAKREKEQLKNPEKYAKKLEKEQIKADKKAAKEKAKREKEQLKNPEKLAKKLEKEQIKADKKAAKEKAKREKEQLKNPEKLAKTQAKADKKAAKKEAKRKKKEEKLAKKAAKKEAKRKKEKEMDNAYDKAFNLGY